MWSCFLAPAESRAFTTAPVASSIIIVSVSLSVYRYTAPWGFPGGANGKELAHQCKRQKRHGFDPWVRKIPWRRSWQPTPVFLPGESHGPKSLSIGPHRVGHNWSDLACMHTALRRRQWHPTPVLLPGKSHGQRSLVGCSPWGRWGSDTTERLHFHFSLSCIGEGNGNPLQSSCLENPRDGGAWWAAVYGVAQSRTRLKWLSSSSSSSRQFTLKTVGKVGKQTGCIECLSRFIVAKTIIKKINIL